jgi:hypothetical protein
MDGRLRGMDTEWISEISALDSALNMDGWALARHGAQRAKMTIPTIK